MSKVYFPKESTQSETIKKSSLTMFNVSGQFKDSDIPITGRTKKNYEMQLFPDLKQKQINAFMKDKDYLDLACGMNHVYEGSLLSSLASYPTKKVLRHGLDIHELELENKSKGKDIRNIRYIQGSVYNMKGLPKYDVITVNNFLYFWELNPKKILLAFKELFHHLKKDGELRIFPVYYGDYSLNLIELHKFINENFWLSCIQPTYSNEIPIFYQDGVHKGLKSDGQVEKSKNTKLMSHTLILKKK
jgi:SAM-dependent methyltransferase